MLLLICFHPPELLNDIVMLLLQVTIWWAGLMRGAVSVALAYKQVNLWASLMDVGCVCSSENYQYV